MQLRGSHISIPYMGVASAPPSSCVACSMPKSTHIICYMPDLAACALRRRRVRRRARRRPSGSSSWRQPRRRLTRKLRRKHRQQRQRRRLPLLGKQLGRRQLRPQLSRRLLLRFVDSRDQSHPARLSSIFHLHVGLIRSLIEGDNSQTCRI